MYQMKTNLDDFIIEENLNIFDENISNRIFLCTYIYKSFDFIWSITSLSKIGFNHLTCSELNNVIFTERQIEVICYKIILLKQEENALLSKKIRMKLSED